jgi:hypothetical protein
MSTSTSTTPAVRTYAADLELMRTKKNVAPKSAPVVVPITSPQPVVAAEQKHDGIVPPFHTFEHKPTNAETAVQNTPGKVITLGSNVTAADVAKEALPAVIITDTKHKRFKLGEAIATGMTSWWGNKKESALKKKVPKYTVPEAERRKGVIQKATAKTGVTSTSDHAAVVARIKATKQAPLARVTTPTVSAPEISVPETPTWENPVQIAPVAKPAEVAPVPEKIITPVLPKTPITQTSTPEVRLARQSSWDSDIQAQVNALGKKPEGEAAAPSKIIITGKEFTKIKQGRAAAEAVKANTIPKIVPTIPVITPQQNIPERATITPLVLPQVETEVPEIKQVTAAPTYREEVLTPVATPTPIERPRITPTIPVIAEGTALPKTEAVRFEPPVSEATVVSQPNIFQTELTEAEQIRGVQTPVPERRFAPPREVKRSFISNLTQTNQLVFIACGVLLFVVASGLGLRSYLQSSSNTVVAQPEVVATAFPTAVMFEAGPNATDKTTLMETIASRGAGNESLVEINFIDPATGQNITASALFDLLETNVLFDFESSITKVTLGGYRTAPWILLTSTDKNTALGGMFDWENTMSSALSPLFGEENPDGTFTDAVVGTTDVRVLKNNTGTEQITYGFIDTNKILITTNTTAFLNLDSNF